MQHRNPTKFAALVLTSLVTIAVSVPTAVWASHQFKDVPNTNPFHNAIDWMKDNGITVGCNPPTNTLYCPDVAVTRGQMAAFLKRLAENRVVDADKVDGLQGSQILRRGPIVISTPASSWEVHDGGGLVNASLSDAWVNVGGNGFMQIPLPTPAIVGGVNYGLQKLEFCYQTITTGLIDWVGIFRSEIDVNGGTLPFSDETDRQSASFGCTTLTTNLLPGKGLSVTVSLLGNSTVRLGSVTATWIPSTGGFS